MATHVYKITADFPRKEKYGLTSHIRRPAMSVPSNFAEGAGRNSDNEFCHFLGVSNGSSCELQTRLIIAKNLELVNNDVDTVIDELDQLQNMNFTPQKRLHHNANTTVISNLNT